MTLLNGVSDYLLLLGLVVIAIPVLIVGQAALYVAVFFGALYLLIFKGIPWALDFFKERHSGAAAASKKYDRVIDGRGWDR